jgi:hypothetical protein
LGLHLICVTKGIQSNLAKTIPDTPDNRGSAVHAPGTDIFTIKNVKIALPDILPLFEAIIALLYKTIPIFLVLMCDNSYIFSLNVLNMPLINPVIIGKLSVLGCIFG